MASTSLAKIELMRCGREVAGALPSGTEMSKGCRDQEPNSVLELEKTSGNSQRTSPSFLDGRNGPLRDM